jgi:hypothetical protein
LDSCATFCQNIRIYTTYYIFSCDISLSDTFKYQRYFLFRFYFNECNAEHLHSFTRHCNLFRDCNIFAKTRLANLIGSCQDIIPLSFCHIKLSKYFVGIFAYLNYLVPRDRKFIIDTLIKGLQRLEYRGYDSTGMFY